MLAPLSTCPCCAGHPSSLGGVSTMFPVSPKPGLQWAGHRLPPTRAVYQPLFVLLFTLLLLVALTAGLAPVTQAAGRPTGGQAPTSADACQFAILDFHPCIDGN